MAVRRNALGKGMNGLFPDYKKKKEQAEAKTEAGAEAKDAVNGKKAAKEAEKKADEKADKKAVKEAEVKTDEKDAKEAEIKADEKTVKESVKGSAEKAEGKSEEKKAEKPADSAENTSTEGDMTSEGADKEGKIVMLPMSEVGPNPDQPRKQFDEDSLLEMAESIRQHGVIQPILVQKKDGYYEIIAGERRWRGAKLAGLKTIPAIIRSYSKEETLEISLIENIQRENLNPIEEAKALDTLLTEFALTQDELAERVGKSRTAITNALRLLKLDKRVSGMVIDEMISAGHARALLALSDGEMQYQAACRVFDQKLSVRETEKLVKILLKDEKEEKKPSSAPSPVLDYIYQDMEDKLKAALGTKVTVNRKKGNKGKIEIEYYSGDELERIYALLRGIGQGE